MYKRQGSYTAGAIASIAYQICVPAVDGNVLRVVSRLTASRDDILKQSVKKRMEQLVGAVIPAERPGAFNQALMELGAMVCVPNGMARCDGCPLPVSYTHLDVYKRQPGMRAKLLRWMRFVKRYGELTPSDMKTV